MSNTEIEEIIKKNEEALKIFYEVYNKIINEEK